MWVFLTRNQKKEVTFILKVNILFFFLDSTFLYNQALEINKLLRRHYNGLPGYKVTLVALKTNLLIQ